MTELYLVLIETSGNQNYIFSTNKLKENIGASELTYQAGTRWILKAVSKFNDSTLLEVWKDSKRLRSLLRNSSINPPIEQRGKPIEILTAASGKALLLTKDKETAQSIVSEITKKALKEAPGLNIMGVYEKVPLAFQNKPVLGKAIGKVHQQFEKARSQLPSPENRFLRLPIVAECASSGLPASRVIQEGERKKPISLVNTAKRAFSSNARERLTNLDQRLERQIDRLLTEDEESEQRSWLAIVHADGNGLGQIFLNFEEYIDSDKSDRNYIETYRKFSLALDECTEAAFKKALEVFPLETTKNKDIVPVVPLIIGGDDLTVVCDGHYALEFMRVFLQEFERQTKHHESINKVARKAFGVDHLSACAGVAIVKRHFPFSVAYGLAEDLIKSAKAVKRHVTCKPTHPILPDTPFPCSAIDFHILYDTSGIDLKDIQARLTPQAQTQLYNRPYIVSALDNLKNANGYEWAQLHAWKRLSDRIHWLNSDTSDDKSPAPLSRSQCHVLRAALFLGKEAADAQYALIQQRYNLADFAESERSLFHSIHQDDGDLYVTSFLDALEAMEFLKNAQTDSLDL